MTFEKSTFLIREGVFSKTRNPAYIGMFLILIGIGFCLGNMLSVFTPFIFIILTHYQFVLKEEKLMLQVFGQKYLDYKTKVKRWI
jgi:protein-S-isoprenylcysteine O-methyltransferase Ste14